MKNTAALGFNRFNSKPVPEPSRKLALYRFAVPGETSFAPAPRLPCEPQQINHTSIAQQVENQMETPPPVSASPNADTVPNTAKPQSVMPATAAKPARLPLTGASQRQPRHVRTRSKLDKQRRWPRRARKQRSRASTPIWHGCILHSRLRLALRRRDHHLSEL